jgi:radical SAM superfamily enzyme YgiQ (UPF0313 family)
MPRILFIQPSQYDHKGKPLKQKRLFLPGLAFPLLAAMTPKHWQVEIKLEVVDDIDFDTDADLIGIGTMGHAAFRGIDLAREFKKRGKIVIMGGYMASMVPEEAQKHADAVVVGDAELAYPELLSDFETTGKIQPVYHRPVSHLDGLPLPHYELLLEKPIGAMLPVQAGRGCAYNCSFCSIACLYKGKYFFRPVAEVIRDVKRVKDLGFREFYLIDDNIASHPTYLQELCEKLRPLKMHWGSQCALHLAKNKKLLDLVCLCGGDMMSFGVESIVQEGLDKLNKSWLRVAEHEKLIAALTERGVLVSTEMIIGTDGDTEESIKKTYDFIQATRIPAPRFYILTPMPGSQFYNELKTANRLLTEDLSRYTGCQCVHKPARISPEKLNSLFWWLLIKVYSLKSILRRTLFHPAFFKNSKRYLLALFVNLHYRKYVKKKIPPNLL